jgi:hypothetical protein
MTFRLLLFKGAPSAKKYIVAHSEGIADVR